MYKIYVVFDGKEMEICSNNEDWDHEESERFMSQAKNYTNIKCELANGNMIAIPEAKMKDVYFIARRI